MKDWRLGCIAEESIKNLKVLHIKFPDFWQKSYNSKNNFYYYIFNEAARHVKLFGKYEEYLSDDRCVKFFHRNCNFCMNPISADMNIDCYCTEDGMTWICSDCFTDFAQKYDWKTEEINDIVVKNFIPLEISGTVE